MSGTATHAYVGICPGCGHMVSAIVDASDSKKRTAQFVSDTVKDGERIERVTLDAARAGLKRCACKQPPPSLFAPAEGAWRLNDTR